VLKGSTWIVDPGPSLCDAFEDCDFTSMSSESCNVISDVTNGLTVGTFLLNP